MRCPILAAEVGPVSSASDDDLRPGRVLGPYELLVPVGVGGMARVWAARVRATGQIVALKMLHPHIAENPSFQEMFLDEARIASRVRHPNVCATFELADHEGVLTMAMEWVDGASLMRLLRPGPEADEGRPRVPVPFRQAVRIVADACAGLHAAHETVGDDGRPLAVVHRDVSPHNVLLTTGGAVKMTDFGVAKALGKSHMTIAGQIKGKLAYMSPEQLMGDGVDRRSDVFALGCVLYEITTGERPFRGEHDPQVMAAIMMGSFAPPSEIVPGYPPELEAILGRALAADPAQRFASAEHLRVALEQWLRTSGPPIEPRHVAALLHERLGGEIADRARAVASIAPQGPSQAVTDSGSGAMEIDRRPGTSPKAASTNGTIWLVLAVMLGAGLGLGVLGWLRATRRPRPAAAIAAPASASAPVALASAPSAEPAATIEVVEPPAPAPTVRLELEPSTATVLVGGVALPPGTSAVARPEDGGSTTIVVRAEQYEDTLVIIDRATPDEIQVALVPAQPTSTARAREVHEAPKPDASASASASAAAPDMPPNPYE